MFASKDIFLKSSGGGGYQISRSVRLRSSASAYFNRTPASAGNRKTWTWSGWVKRGALGVTNNNLIQAEAGGNTNAVVLFNSSDQLRFFQQVGGVDNFQLITTQVFRDPSAWYHIVVQLDTTQATSTNRAKLYVNGSQITALATAVYPAQNFDGSFNNNVAQYIGAWLNVPAYFDGYLTEVNFIDGQALTPSSFGETNAVTGVWQPKAYTGTYGTNGFELNFSDNSNNTAATIGKDYSGNGNNWTPNNISVTAGVTYDSMLDVPTNYDDGTVYDRGNYPVINPLNNSGGTTVADGNLKTTWGSASSRSVLNTMAIPSSGKFYAEFVVGTLTSASVAASFGLATESVARTSDGYGASGAWVYYASNQSYISRNGTSSAQIGSNQTFAAGGIVQVAVDRTNNQAWLGYNNVWVNATNGTDGNPSAGTNPTVSSLPADLFIIIGLYANSGNVNFGQRPFSYTPPTGFVALNTQNLPAPTISNGAQYMAATLYTGTGSALTIANTVGSASFQPDLVWVKGRSGATDHAWYDAVRGVQLQLESNTTTAETTETTGLTAFGSTGFTVGALAQMNTNTATYVAWQWNAGGSTVTNTSGSISAQVRANTTAGFSVVTYTGNGITSATVGHGLGVTPAMIIVKSRSTTTDWFVRHQSLAAGYQLRLNSTAAQEQVSSATTNGGLGSGTSSVINFISGSTNTSNVNASGGNFVAYCFSEVAGYSKFGSYTGNGSTDGVFVYLGFRPRFVITKSYDSTAGVGDWTIHDTSRLAYNTNDLRIFANASSAESTSEAMDMLSNGFKIRTTNSNCNTSGGGYIYMAFAENPFKLSLAR
jgi:hypothetical protein